MTVRTNIKRKQKVDARYRGSARESLSRVRTQSPAKKGALPFFLTQGVFSSRITVQRIRCSLSPRNFPARAKKRENREAGKSGKHSHLNSLFANKTPNAARRIYYKELEQHSVSRFSYFGHAETFWPCRFCRIDAPELCRRKDHCEGVLLQAGRRREVLGSRKKIEAKKGSCGT